LIVLVPRGHDDKDVNIAIGMRRAIGVRTKQNDFVRLKSVSDPAREAADHLKRYIRPAVAPLRRLRQSVLASHAKIIPRMAARERISHRMLPGQE